MPKIVYQDKSFSAKTREVIDRANSVLEDYARRGFDLTLRQLYYQFVSRAWIANKQSEYKRLGNIISDARLAGLVDWHHLVDRTRNLEELGHWTSPADIIYACAQSYREEMWASQPTYVEVWIEKDALVGVLSKACTPLDVPYFSCRGYTSQSEMWGAAMRLRKRGTDKFRPSVVIHLGDHDPSGIDMTRDIQERLGLLSHGADITVKRIALTMEQVRQYNPPPNPAKVTDSRFQAYLERYSDESWELDALDPDILVSLIQGIVREYIDQGQWDLDNGRVEERRGHLKLVEQNWDSVSQYVCRKHAPALEG